MAESIKVFGIVSLVVLVAIGVVASLLFTPNGTSFLTKVVATKPDRPNDETSLSYFTLSGSPLPEGFQVVSTDGSLFQLIGKLQDVYTDFFSRNIYIMLEINSSKPAEKIIISNGTDIDLPFSKQNVHTFAPNSSNTHLLLLKPTSIIPTLTSYKGKDVLAFFLLRLPPNVGNIPAANLLRKYISCNQTFAADMQSGKNTPSSCTPYASEFHVYDANL